ncbi:QueT transporter family protein [Mariniplasma anaerobium]|uniref:Membrane protein n=1 Tax=Mariniplasma anaerobium TaxID=2735436 RepID=A0A7U9TIE9_9MOLU|nr:QueT transporter family protein [Mariniplasma anaerobium]BCR35932.1 membrane protein [Mariniplasma anaerobium]
MKNFELKDFIKQSTIASIYVVLVFIFQFLSFETIQFRIAEFLLILVFFDKKSIVGLLIGTFLANYLMSPYGLVDALFGTLASFLALVLMMIFSKYKLISLIFPALSNALVIGLMISLMNDIPFLPIASWVFLGEAVVMYVVGYPLYIYFNKNKHFKEMMGS